MWRMAARRVAEGRDVSDRYERVPPPEMAVAYRNEVAAQAEAQSASIQALIGAIQEHTSALDRNTAALDRAAGLWP
ncbi:hypothetical protein D6C78_07390 [Aureobasidium pullulans]|uniref:Uncharacterized protein n=1 Tax=Aureobasidium pullulans TaxID=5580 RepID=A0A4T0BH21_AURPU|nr:hypothetical protein D6C78_07390 [Aureobasidium pullulans]